MTESYRCWAEVDLSALRENLARIRACVGPNRKILTVVKADAYGHGLRQIAAVLMQSGTDIFGVANLAEGKAIRSVGKGWPILMLGACLPSEVEPAVRDGIMPTLSTLDEARRFSAAAARQHKVIAVQLKLDTGMGRLGTFPGDLLSLAHEVNELPGLALAGLYTHFAVAEDSADITAQQRETFNNVVEQLLKSCPQSLNLHCSNSAGVLLEPHGHCNLVRAGLLVYGVIPPGTRLRDPAIARQFRPALSWKCRVSLVREVPTGTAISYGQTFVAPKRLRVAILTAGYGDGYFRSGSNRAHVLISGQRCPVLGRVTMDQTIVDATELTSVQAGDEVTLIGAQGTASITANDLAEWCQTIPWEVLTNITYRVPRIYRGCEAA